jgi:iron-sulfur cluster repair protein YtfE (RIC family)
VTSTAADSRDPLRAFEHSHEHLTRRALEASELLRAFPSGTTTEETRGRLRTCLEGLRDELLRHFAVEEEGLFPYIRAHVPAKAPIVERLALAHDAICGSVVRLAHAAATEGTAGAALSALYERFQAAYALHSREEADLLAELARILDAAQRSELAALLHGL